MNRNMWLHLVLTFPPERLSFRFVVIISCLFAVALTMQPCKFVELAGTCSFSGRHLDLMYLHHFDRSTIRCFPTLCGHVVST